jgi:multiple sugar transport system permease protein
MADGLIARANRRLRPFGLTVGEVPVWLGGLIISLLWAAPFVWMVSTSLKHSNEVMTLNIEWLPPHPTLENYIRIFSEYPVLRWGLNSVVVAVISTALSVLSGALAGYALARLRFPGRDLLFGIFVASLMVPTEVCVVPLLLAMIKIGWANSYQALILPSVGNVFSVYIFRQFFLKFPNDLEDAAKMDGASQMLIFWKIAFPLARAPLIAATVILFTLNWNNFLWPLLITFDDSMKTLPVGIAAFAPVVGTHTQLEGFALGMAGITILSLPSLLLFLGLQRYFIQGIASGALRG